MDVLDDPTTCQDGYFTEANSCLVINKPETLMRVRDQERTFTCYAFVATATMFGDEVKTRKRSTEGSTQEILDYIHEYKRPKSVPSEGGYEVSQRGYPNNYKAVFGYVKDVGLSRADDYPWVGRCKFKRCDGNEWDRKVENKEILVDKDQKIYITGYEKITPTDVDKYLRSQPITGKVLLTDQFKTWGNGIFKGEGKAIDEGGHAVTIVGYGRKEGDDYFICQNSYGLNWGHRGYFKVLRSLITCTYIPVGTRSPCQGRLDEAGTVGTEESGEEEQIGYPDAKRQRVSLS